jgi:PAS domain S-box-containing protein
MKDLLSLRDVPIQRKLTVIIMATCAVALVMTCLTFLIYETANSNITAKANLATTAALVGENSQAALMFNDSKAASNNLAMLSAVPSVRAGAIYDANDKLFASYQRLGVELDVPLVPGAEGIHVAGVHAKLFQSICNNQERIGTVYLQSDLSEAWGRFGLYASIIAAVMLAALLVAWQLSSKLQRVISEPIYHLLGVAKSVSDKKDYSLRASGSGRDELGRLVAGFNAMLGEIQQRDQALSQSEEHFRSLIENASDIITLLDAHGVVTYESPSVERILGYRPEELVGRPYTDIVHPDDLATIVQYLASVKGQGGKAVSVEVRLLHKNGAWIAFESIMKNLLDNPAVRAIVANSRNVSERKEAEQKLKAFANSLERSNRELTDFAYVASHDLQEPLRKIHAFGDRLKDKCKDALGDQGRDYLDRMQDAARRMQTLITDLLQFSRVTTKAQPFVAVQLNRIVREVLGDLEVRIEQAGAEVELGDLPTIEADPLQMRQLVQNLVGNALKFHDPTRKPMISITAQSIVGKRKGGNGALCRLIVKDNGIGFDEKYAERIFVIFQRLHGRGEYEGTGVGLAICKEIVERHGGSIEAASKPGEGATFTVTLPVHHNAKMEHEPREA